MVKLVRILMEQYGLTENRARIAVSYAEGLTNSEMARRYNLTTGAVSGRLSLIKNQLKLESIKAITAFVHALEI